MESQTLQAKTRTLVGRKTYHLRNEGIIPAVVYGSGTKPMNIEVSHKEFATVLKKAGESTIVELVVDGGKAMHVLIQDMQTDPMRDEFTHADFRAVDMTKKLEAEVKLHFIGESGAVKGLGGTLVRPMDEIRVRALPKDLVSFIEVDISKLATFDDMIKVKELPVPAGVEIIEDEDAVVALVAAPRSEEEMAELSKAVEIDVTAVEKVEKEKKSDDESAEDAEAKK
ncbi:50S ribosomal protein L25 [bacterium]|nr:50S ribosomal protein L25 [bacterium]